MLVLIFDIKRTALFRGPISASKTGKFYVPLKMHDNENQAKR